MANPVQGGALTETAPLLRNNNQPNRSTFGERHPTLGKVVAVATLFFTVSLTLATVAVLLHVGLPVFGAWALGLLVGAVVFKSGLFVRNKYWPANLNYKPEATPLETVECSRNKNSVFELVVLNDQTAQRVRENDHYYQADALGHPKQSALALY